MGFSDAPTCKPRKLRVAVPDVILICEDLTSFVKDLTNWREDLAALFLDYPRQLSSTRSRTARITNVSTMMQ